MLCNTILDSVSSMYLLVFLTFKLVLQSLISFFDSYIICGIFTFQKRHWEKGIIIVQVTFVLVLCDHKANSVFFFLNKSAARDRWHCCNTILLHMKRLR